MVTEQQKNDLRAAWAAAEKAKEIVLGKLTVDREGAEYLITSPDEGGPFSDGGPLTIARTNAIDPRRVYPQDAANAKYLAAAGNLAIPLLTDLAAAEAEIARLRLALADKASGSV